MSQICYPINNQDLAMFLHSANQRNHSTHTHILLKTKYFPKKSAGSEISSETTPRLSRYGFQILLQTTPKTNHLIKIYSDQFPLILPHHLVLHILLLIQNKFRIQLQHPPLPSPPTYPPRWVKPTMNLTMKHIGTNNKEWVT